MSTVQLRLHAGEMKIYLNVSLKLCMPLVKLSGHPSLLFDYVEGNERKTYMATRVQDMHGDSCVQVQRAMYHLPASQCIHWMNKSRTRRRTFTVTVTPIPPATPNGRRRGLRGTEASNSRSSFSTRQRNIQPPPAIEYSPRER